MKMRNLSFILSILFASILSFPINAQYPFITRVDGVGAGNNFLKITPQTRDKILDGTFDGEIVYIPNKGPIQIDFMSSGSVLGNYELTLSDDTPDDDELGPDIFWSLTNLDLNQTVNSSISINDMPEQEVPEFGLIVKATETLDAGELGPNNGAIGYEIAYSNSGGQQWLDWVPDQFNGMSTFDYVLTSPGQIDSQYDPEEKLTKVSDGLFYPYQLLSSPLADENKSGPFWNGISTHNSLVRDIEGRLPDLKNVDIVFTSNKNNWSRCVILESATSHYYSTNPADGLGLSTEYDESYQCEVMNFDLRGDYSVSKFDSDGDGLPDYDNEIDFEGEDKIGMGWFPGYAIDVETGKRLNIFFAENSTYSLDQDPTLLDALDISANDFNGQAVGRDMMWNPTDETIIDAGDADGFPYQNYMGGQHFIFVTEEEYDGCEYMYNRLRCIKTNLQKVNALRRILWTSFPIMAEGNSLLPYEEGLIPNDVTIRLRVDNPYQVEEGTGISSGYPTYQFELLVSNNPDHLNPLSEINISPNPFKQNSGQVIYLEGLKQKADISILDVNGKLIDFIELEGRDIAGDRIDLLKKSNHIFSQGTYLVQIKNKDGFTKTLKLIVI